MKALNPRGVGTASPPKRVHFLFDEAEKEWSTTEALSILGIGISPRSELL
jgi:hypothetical protein